MSYSDFFKCAKRRRRKKFAHSYFRNALRDFLQIWCVVSLGRWAPPQQLWDQPGKRLQSYECVKIATLLFLLIYSLPFVRAPFSWAARHTTLCLDNFTALHAYIPVNILTPVCVRPVSWAARHTTVCLDPYLRVKTRYLLSQRASYKSISSFFAEI